MYCENCGTKIDDNAKFCSNCGAPNNKMARNEAQTSNLKETQPVVTKKAESKPVEKNNGKLNIKVIAGCVAGLAAVCLLFMGRETLADDSKLATAKVIKAIPKEHREFMTKLGISVVDDKNVEFNHYNGKLTSYKFKKDDKKQREVFVTVEDSGAIRDLSLYHKKENGQDCNSSYYIVESGKVLGDIEGLYKQHLQKDAIELEKERQAEAKRKAEIAEREAKERQFANYLGCTVEDYRSHFGPMLNAGFERGRLQTWYNDSSSTSVNTYGNNTQYVLHLVGKGQNGRRVYVNVYEYSHKPGQYQFQVMNSSF